MKRTVFINEDTKVTNAELVQRKKFFHWVSSTNLFNEGRVPLEIWGGRFRRMYHSNMPTLCWGEQRPASSQVPMKSQSHSCPTLGQEFCYSEEGLQKWRETSHSEAQSVILGEARLLWLKLNEGRCWKLSINLDPTWTPTSQARVAPRSQESSRAVAVFLNFSYRFIVMWGREAGSNYLKPGFNCI